ncbi:unnamed protein product, partial [Chrysoparadoxa australica]
MIRTRAAVAGVKQALQATGNAVAARRQPLRVGGQHRLLSSVNGGGIDVVKEAMAIARAAEEAEASHLPGAEPLEPFVPLDELSALWPPDAVMKGVDWVAQTGDVSYLTAIVGLTVMTRALLFPWAIKGTVNAARMSALQEETDRIKTWYEKHKPKSPGKAQEEIGAMYKTKGVRPGLSVLVPLSQIPIFLSAFVALRKIGDYCPGMADGGMLWFTDLASPDTTYILPVITAASFLAMGELGSEAAAASKPEIRAFMRVPMPIIMTFFSSGLPAGLFCYWLPANLFSIGQALMLRTDWGKKKWNLPDRRPPPPPLTSKATFIEVLAAPNPLKGLMQVRNGGLGSLQAPLVLVYFVLLLTSPHACVTYPHHTTPQRREAQHKEEAKRLGAGADFGKYGADNPAMDEIMYGGSKEKIKARPEPDFKTYTRNPLLSEEDWKAWMKRKQAIGRGKAP